VLCCGFDSAVSDRAHRLRWPHGRRRYDVAILAELARLRSREVTLVLDGEPMTVPVTLVAVGNTPWYGGGMKVCPGADPSDGTFDVTAHRAVGVELASPGVMSWADGEPVAPLPAVAECVAGALTVVGTARA
jgi:diacylglycerol kinase (ATP)